MARRQLPISPKTSRPALARVRRHGDLLPDDDVTTVFLLLQLRKANRGDFDLISYGRDGRPGGAGEDADVTNW